jgi:hypothetical protein
MIDTLLKHREKAQSLGKRAENYALVTLHRPSNVDDPAVFGEILEALRNIAEEMTVIFPIHPRTAKRITEYGFDTGKICITKPFGYLEFLNLTSQAKVVLTDSGGFQEETTIMRIPCLTLRNNTERPVTITWHKHHDRHESRSHSRRISPRHQRRMAAVRSSRIVGWTRCRTDRSRHQRVSEVRPSDPFQSEYGPVYTSQL